MTAKLPDRFRDQVAALPEIKYGVSRITVTLDDGTVCRDVDVAWGRDIVKVGNSANIPFDANRIVRVQRQ